MTCFIGSDHAGLILGREISDFLHTIGVHTHEYFPKAKSADYPDYAKIVCEKILQDSTKQSMGILICGSGIGMSIAANKFRGIRAALCLNEFMARHARAHNDANVLCLGERIIGAGLARDIVKIFVNTEFEGGRHLRRVNKIHALYGL